MSGAITIIEINSFCFQNGKETISVIASLLVPVKNNDVTTAKTSWQNTSPTITGSEMK